MKNPILKNILSVGLVEGLSLIIPIATMSLLSRVISVTEYGNYLLFISIVVFGHTFADFTSQIKGIRESANVDDKDGYDKIYYRVQFKRFISVSVYFFIVLAFLFFIGNKELLNKFSIYGSIYLFGYVLTSAWYYQSINKMEKLVINTLITKGGALIAIFLFVKGDDDIGVLYISTACTMLLSGLLLRYNLNNYNIKFGFLRYPINIFREINSDLKVFLGLLMPNLYNSIPVIVFGSLYNDKNFVYFALAQRLGSILFTAQKVMQKALYPIIVKDKDNTKFLKNLLLFNGSLAMIFIISNYLFGGQLIDAFLSEKYAKVHLYFYLILFGLLFSGMSSALTTAYLLPNGLDDIYSKVSIRVSIFASLISVALGYLYGVFGVLVSITIARILLFSYYSFHCIKFRRLNNEKYSSSNECI
ncbi:Membrane protein involved in the export of O-antigen and teichoic acid [Vibrio xiamenensis]|uniref:Membrane protein involved in the export of O-antigen and teichoic acid n=1 Tax=Vibrio xiamenensis TaxID=861298 RepID=A0A1G8C7E4_9VIBR|nr:oligosaccharide flippase family protein [Vibrio xiamenensis]SDH41436.1 Membrane protein involved in the export of O-antigen and teichoic acid [Vibrio xiamenensis]